MCTRQSQKVIWDMIMQCTVPNDCTQLSNLLLLLSFSTCKHTMKFSKISPRASYIFQRRFLRGSYIERNLLLKISQAYTGKEIYVSKLIGLAHSWKEIYVSNFQKAFTKTRLEDKDLSKTQPCKYFFYMERGNPSQELRGCPRKNR